MSLRHLTISKIGPFSPLFLFSPFLLFLLPQEYRREPELALAGGKDGLDLVRIILREAPSHLETEGILVVEFGHNRDDLEMTFPDIPFIWLDTSAADRHVFLLRREDLV